VKYRNRFGRQVTYSSGFEGVIPYIERQFAEA
jgi:excinuclease ABC subunit A